MAESLAEDASTIYKTFCNVADAFEFDYDGSEFIFFGPQDTLDHAFDYVNGYLFDEGIGMDLSDEQILMVSRMAIASKAAIIFPDLTLPDGENFND